MAVNRKKEQQKETIKYDVKVIRATECKSGDIALDLEVNGVSIYGCFYVTRQTKNGEASFITFPQRKGSDGKYYKYVYFPISDEQLSELEKEIEALI